MSKYLRATTLGVLFFAAGCATTSVPPLRSDFADVPLLEGLAYQPGESVVIETRNVRTARLVYRGRMEAGSAVVEMQKGLEANGWRHLNSTGASKHGTTQVYDKDGDTLQVLVWEGVWYTYAEYTMGRVVKGATASTGTPLPTTTPVTATPVK